MQLEFDHRVEWLARGPGLHDRGQRSVVHVDSLDLGATLHRSGGISLVVILIGQFKTSK